MIHIPGSLMMEGSVPEKNGILNLYSINHLILYELATD